ncbi:transmembrane protein 268 [Ixodes scapularis]|nr:transmembrane protein 268 [Ixodes scapularis]XP_029842067.1 transmembrane protein 268 [Ixodes scapularis]
MSEDLESGPEPKLSREPSPQAEAQKSSWVKFDEDGSAAATLEPSQSVQMEPPSPAKLEAPLRKVPSPEPRPDLGPLPPPRPPLVGSPSAPAGAVCPPAPARLKPRASAQPGDNNNHVALPSARRVEPLAVPLSERLATRTTSSSGFSNGDVIVNALPTNKRCAWITKAEFKPELVPEELMASGLTLTVEEYVAAMQVLVHDVRFTLYNVCYKRLLLVWVLLGFFILLCLLFSGVRGLALFGGGVVWLVVNAMGIFVCMWLKFKLLHMLERCIASINSLFFRHKILLGLDDRGKISCHKVHLIFVYFDVSPCIRYLYEMLENQDRQDALDARAAGDAPSPARNGAALYPVDRARMDIDTSDIIITGGSSTTRISQREKYAEKLLLRYSQRWVKEFVRKRLDLNMPVHPDGFEDGPCPPAPPRHCAMARCPCQFIEEHLRFKPLTKCSLSELCF